MVNISIDPILLRWGPITIGWHGIWGAVGMIIAFLVVVLEGRRKGIDQHYLSELVVWAALLGYAGARLLHVLDRWEFYGNQPLRILAIHRGGTTVYGALIGGTIAMLAYARWKHLSFWNLADAVALGIPVAQILGRFGCTINGDIWGMPTGGTWGLVYWHPNTEIPAHMLGVPTFPIPTMLQVWNTGLLALLLVLRMRLHVSGVLFLICVMLYSVGRFIVNIWQPNEPFLFGLKQTQVIALSIIGFGSLLLVYLMTKQSRKADSTVCQ